MVRRRSADQPATAAEQQPSPVLSINVHRLYRRGPRPLATAFAAQLPQARTLNDRTVSHSVAVVKRQIALLAGSLSVGRDACDDCKRRINRQPETIMRICLKISLDEFA